MIPPNPHPVAECLKIGTANRNHSNRAAVAIYSEFQYSEGG